MRIFTRFAKTLVSKDPRVCNSGSFSEQFLKKRLFGLRNYRVKLQYFIKHLFPDLESWEKCFDIFNNTISISLFTTYRFLRTIITLCCQNETVFGAVLLPKFNDKVFRHFLTN